MRFMTAGESHGPVLTLIVEGLPAGLPFEAETLNVDLRRRAKGHGRGGRMKVERDEVTILGGVRLGVTTGAPVALQILNRDHVNWLGAMSPAPRDLKDAEREAQLALRKIDRLRPGHADYAGAVKYGLEDVRDVLERASARETAARVVAGGCAKLLLGHLGIDVLGSVQQIGSVCAVANDETCTLSDLRERSEASPVRCCDLAASSAMVAEIDAAKRAGTSLGGVIEVRTSSLPTGLGSYVHWDRRLDGRLAQAVMSIPAIKGVAFGRGFELASLPGHEAQDTFLEGFARVSNQAGGLEGGVTNGQPLVLRAVKKPISTLPRPLTGATWPDGEPVPAHFERADTCAVPAAAVVAEAMVAWVLAEACLEKYGGDSLRELLAHYEASEREATAARQRFAVDVDSEGASANV
ncbi:MAG: chorismate synthase [Candidatus Sericytochromatia bacterium]|nr:chorismate synthase [Candidatus Sericytochromatia bacterium]